MDNRQTTLRTKETQVLLRQMDEVLEKYAGTDFSKALHGPQLEQVWRSIHRARRQFDSKLFFIVVFGPLKAGKSTLTNALAGEYVSPAGFGKETTRRPSLVMRASESRIDQYFSTDSDVNLFLSQRRLKGKATGSVSAEEEISKIGKVRDTFDMVADYLRGIPMNENEFQSCIRTTSLPLNVSNLDATLTKDLPTEPLFTVIRCKGGHLLNEGVAIVDMPGLDGSWSNWRDDPIHEWVISRAEFFLFVQSSVAALNRETRDFVQQVIAQSTQPPIWLIQNIFDARHWQPEDKRRKDEEQQREEGKERVIDLLDQAPRSVLAINLGLAWDGKTEPGTDWLEHSAFPKFEEELSQVLHAERGLIQEGNSITNLRQWLDKSKTGIKHIDQLVSQVRTHNQKMQETFNLAQSLIAAVNYRSDWEEDIQGAISTMATTMAKPWLDSLGDEIDELRIHHNRERTGKEVNDALKLVAGKVGAGGDSKYFAKSQLLPLYLKWANKYCQSAENDAVNACNKLLNGHNMGELPDALQPSVENLPSMLQDPFTTDPLQEKKKIFNLGINSWVDKKYDGTTIHAHIQDIANSWESQIRARTKIWGSQLRNEHYSTYCESRRKRFLAHLQKLKKDFEMNSQRDQEAATAAEILLRQTNEALFKLEIPLTNAVYSMKRM